MSGEGGGAGAGAGSAPVQTPAPFQMDSDRLKQLMLNDKKAKLEELEDLLEKERTVEVRFGKRGGEVGLNVTKDGKPTPYAWSTIAAEFESGELATKWGIKQGVLNKFFEHGS